MWRAPARRFCAGSPPPARSAGRAPPSAPSPRPGPGAPRSSPPAPARGGHGAGAAPPLAGVGGAVARLEGFAGLRSTRLARGAQRDPETARALSGKRRAPPGTSVSGTRGKGRRRLPRPRPLSRAPAAPPRVPAAVLRRSLPPLSSLPLLPSRLLFSAFRLLFPTACFSLLSTSLCFHPLTPSFVSLFLFLYVFPSSIFFSSFLCISNLLSLVLFPLLSLRGLYCCLPPSLFLSPCPPLPPMPGRRELSGTQPLCTFRGGSAGGDYAVGSVSRVCEPARARAHIHTLSLDLEFADSSPLRPVGPGP